MKHSKQKVAEKRRRKSQAAYLAGGGSSKYAKKHKAQKKGKYSPRSPFRAVEVEVPTHD